MKINPDQELTLLIKPIKGCVTHIEPFEYKTTFQEIEDSGVATLLIDNGHWEFMGHPSDHFEVLDRYTSEDKSKTVVFIDGSYLKVTDGITWEYENDPNWLTTIH